MGGRGTVLSRGGVRIELSAIAHIFGRCLSPGKQLMKSMFEGVKVVGVLVIIDSDDNSPKCPLELLIQQDVCQFLRDIVCWVMAILAPEGTHD